LIWKFYIISTDKQYTRVVNGLSSFAPRYGGGIRLRVPTWYFFYSFSTKIYYCNNKYIYIVYRIIYNLFATNYGIEQPASPRDLYLFFFIIYTLMSCTYIDRYLIIIIIIIIRTYGHVNRDGARGTGVVGRQ
jgi:hypothetical protein